MWAGSDFHAPSRRRCSTVDGGRAGCGCVDGRHGPGQAHYRQLLAALGVPGPTVDGRNAGRGRGGTDSRSGLLPWGASTGRWLWRATHLPSGRALTSAGHSTAPCRGYIRAFFSKRDQADQANQRAAGRPRKETLDDKNGAVKGSRLATASSKPSAACARTAPTFMPASSPAS